MSTRKDVNDLYITYVEALHEAYEDEAHFMAGKPKSPELAAKAKEAYKKFDEVRKKVYGLR